MRDLGDAIELNFEARMMMITLHTWKVMLKKFWNVRANAELSNLIPKYALALMKTFHGSIWPAPRR
jgi:hypothetical protein